MFLYLSACPQLVEINPQKDTGHENVPVEHTCPEDLDQPMSLVHRQTLLPCKRNLTLLAGPTAPIKDGIQLLEIRGFVDGMSLKIHFLASQFT